jgi:hypothetical protein
VSATGAEFSQVLINGNPTLWMGDSLSPALLEKLRELGRHVVGKIVVEQSAQMCLVGRG